QVVSVIVSRAQRVCTAHDAPFHFCAESEIAGAAVHLRKSARFRSTKAVAHAIEPRQVGGSLSCGDNVVRRDRIFRMWQRDLDNLAAKLGELLNGSFDSLSDLRVEAFAKIDRKSTRLNSSHLVI